ncbi:MAG: electron transport complex protein RnfG [Psychromonas sp.]|jgi:electron transport complex protein RnfG|uniref:electron transport complex subunit RsxG n=1 Tax=Psychromonas sp. TaxID=1884585 RepID=UPI0039E332D7
MFSTISRNAYLLAAFAVVCTGSIAIVNEFTQPIIAQQEQKALLRTLNQLIPADLYDNDIVASCFMVTDKNLLGSAEPQHAFIAKKDNRPVALMLKTSTMRGYAGRINLVVGIYADARIAGVRVLHHSETPGLGDRIQTNKSDWIYSFNDKSYEESQESRWEVKKNGGDFDAFTGATITPRAVVFAVKDALIYFQKNKKTLFKHEATCGESL